MKIFCGDRFRGGLVSVRERINFQSQVINYLSSSRYFDTFLD